ncbi:hypothetical protein GGR51DRAFT_573998 [Nemania sp. FL0031]|nr:hypothetical protein GGR51DRAFT_573998 [Nemania sp. FL0031]
MNSYMLRPRHTLNYAHDGFPQYRRLPPELRLMIWDIYFEMFWTMGAHRFELVHDNDRTRLRVQPNNYQNNDESFWRHRLALCRVDKFSFDCLLRFERRNTIVYKELKRRRAKKENGIRATVGKDDLTTFWFHYGATQASLALLSLNANRDVFAGIRYIGVENEFRQQGWLKSPRFRPFACACFGNVHNGGPCISGFVNFIQYFKDIRVFFFIVNVTFDSIPFNAQSTLPVLRLRRPEGPIKSEWKADIFRYFQELAELNGLHVFGNRLGTYCEVREMEARGIVRQQVMSVFHTTRILRALWVHYKRQHKPQSDSWVDIQFSVLLWYNQRTAFRGHEYMEYLRPRAPWL